MKVYTHIKAMTGSFLLLISISGFTGQAQTNRPLNKAMQAIASPKSRWGWIEFNKDLQIDPLTIFIRYKEAFELSQDDVMMFTRSNTDNKVRNMHYRYNQYYKGVKIDGAEYAVHQKPDGRVYGANGKIAVGLNLSVAPKLSASQALQVLFNSYADESKGAWNDGAREQELKTESGDQEATFYPVGELLIHRIDLSKGMEAENLALAWKFEVRMIPGANSKVYYLEAHSGLLLNVIPMARICTSGDITFPVNYGYGNRTVSSKNQTLTSDYELTNNCSAHAAYNVHTKNADFDSTLTFSGAAEFTSPNVHWNGNNTEKSGAMVHWCVERAEIYYRTVHVRNSWNDNNGNIETLANYDHGSALNNGNNACWDCENNKLTVGFGISSASLTDDLSTIDIVGHELTHGVTEDEVGLVYSGESGAINESISDCFGEAIENHVLGSNDWFNGSEVGAVRSLSSPGVFPYNDAQTYLDNNWVTVTGNCNGSNDQCGVHTNSGVGNYWFYLLSVGGSGINNNNEVYDVSGIGIENAADIIYYALTSAYMTSTDPYNDYREATIRSAEDLFGSCSNEVVQAGKAWYAVGVNPNFTVYNYQRCGTIDGNFPSGGPIHRGINSVTSGGTGCTATVDPTFLPVIFAGGNFVELKEGFTATHSGNNTFTAMTDDCSFSAYLKTAAASNQPDEGGDAENKEASGMFTLSPNPARHSVTITFNTETESHYRLMLLDITGRTVKATEGIYTAGKSEIRMNIENIPAGMYQLLLMRNGAMEMKKLLVE